MPSQGPLSPTTFANDGTLGGTIDWVNISNVAASDNADASISFGSIGDVSRYLKATGYGFSIPTGSTIDGIVVAVERAETGIGFVRDVHVAIAKNGVVGATNRADTTTNWPGADGYASYGSSSDLWGETWAPADINDVDFGCAISVTCVSGASTVGTIDHMRVTVYYTDPPPPAGGEVSVTETVTITTAGDREAGPDFDLRATLAVPGTTDFYDRLRSYSVRRGRPGNLDRVEAGEAELLFNDGYDQGTTNNGAPLDPSNVDSPYYPYVRVLIEAALLKQRSGILYPRFKGLVERFEPTWMPPSYQEQKVIASDAFEALSSLTLESDHATLTTALSGSNNDLVFTAREAGGRGDDITIEYVVADPSQVLDTETNDPIEGEAVAYISTPYVKPTLYDYIGGRGSSGTTRTQPVAVVPISFAAQGTNITVTVATSAGSAPLSTASQIKAQLESDPSVMALVSVALAPGNSGAGVVTVMAKTNLSGGKWVQEFSGARINRALDVVGWPTSRRDIDPGLFEVVPQGFSERDNVSALAHMQDVADSELGYVFVTGDGIVTFHDGGRRGRETRSTVSQATYADANAGVGYVYHKITPEYSKDEVRNRVMVTAGYSGAEPQVAEDAASQLLYSPVAGVAVPRDYSKQTLLASDADALAVAQAILAAYKDARVRFPSITLLDDGRYDEDEEDVYSTWGEGTWGSGLFGGTTTSGDGGSPWDEAVLGREIGDLVTLLTKPPSHNSTGTYACYIEEIIDDQSPGMPLAVTFSLSLESEALEVEPPGGALLDAGGDPFILDSATEGVLG